MPSQKSQKNKSKHMPCSCYGPARRQFTRDLSLSDQSTLQKTCVLNCDEDWLLTVLLCRLLLSLHCGPTHKAMEKDPAGHDLGSAAQHPSTRLSPRFILEKMGGLAFLAPLGHHSFIPSFSQCSWVPFMCHMLLSASGIQEKREYRGWEEK